MRIAIDAMGGDNAPFEIVNGVSIAAKNYPTVDFLLIGNESAINDCFKELDKSSNISIVHAESVVTMEDDPMVITKEKNDSSMAVGLKMLKNGECDGFLSAGSTGALHVGSTLIVRKIKGIRRSAIASIIPYEKPILLLDSGANTDVTEDVLNQWAILGSVYINQMYGVDNVRVGLLNNGTEEHKGPTVYQNAYQALKNNEKINFVGNVESKELSKSPCDVLITDGFAGNILLKSIEGMGKFLLGELKKIYSKNLKTKLSYLMVKNDIMTLKSSFDASSYGGAPLLGLNKPVVKAHGSSKHKDIVSAIKQLYVYIESGIIEKVSNELN